MAEAAPRRRTAVSAAARREGWLDGLRILAAFLVIVNHTNSYVFKAASPGQAEWWLSIALYYLSKIAVPLFVMISGACLLPKRDGWRTAGRRALRVLLVLLLFSYGYYAYDAWINWGLWPRLANLGAFLNLVWAQQITDSFWYLYFYLGLMAMLPFLQRLAQALRGRELLGLLGACFFLDGLWPLIAHYAPGLAAPSFFQVPLFTAYIGLFFAGYWIRGLKAPSREQMLGAGLALAACLAVSVALTRIEYSLVAPGEKYWFMDDRLHPALPTVLAAVCMLLLFKGWLSRPSSRALAELGGCAFGIYLVQDWLIAQSRYRLFEPLCGVLPAFPSAILWEIAVFAAALAAAWLLRRIPGLKRLL